MPEGRRPRGVTPRPRSGGSGRECQTATAQERKRGATPRPRPGPRLEELPHAPMPEARGGGGGSNPTFKEPWLRGRRRA